MPALSQTRFPRLWLLMQQLIGGNNCKRRIALEPYRGEPTVLEIGCSVGNVSDAFRAFSGISFTGIDIDPNAIALAQRRFRDAPNFRFSLCSLETLAARGEGFDYVLFAGMLHHVDDETGRSLLRNPLRCLAPNGRLVIYEPEAVRDIDGWFFRAFYALFEQGAFLRTCDALRLLVESSGIELSSVEDRMVSPGIVQRPYVARFNLLIGTSSGTHARVLDQ